MFSIKKSFLDTILDFIDLSKFYFIMLGVSSKDGNSYFFQIYCPQKVLSKSSRNLIQCGISKIYLYPEGMGLDGAGFLKSP